MAGARAEICVVGGGPAGSTIARRLAQLGHDVRLLERSRFPRPHVGESLPPTILPALDLLGVRREVEDTGFLRPDEAIVHWAGAPRRKADREGLRGFQVDRGRFDGLLLDAAAAAGVRVVQPATARVPQRHGEGWRLEVAHGDGVGTLDVRYLVDATGKASVLHRRRRRRLSPPTLALFAYWRGVALAGPETRIEASDAEWFWGAPLPDGTFNATVFVDPRRALEEDISIPELYASLLGRSELLAGCLDGELAGPIRGCDATSYVEAEPIFDGGLRVGESCFAIDPLSSQGVQAAIRSALQAAAVVHTVLSFPADAGAAVEFYRQRVAETSDRHAGIARRFYAAEARRRARPSSFWQSRGRDDDRPAAAPRRELPGPDDLVRFDDRARLTPTPVLVGERITRRTALVHPALERPIAFVGDRGVATLLEDTRSVASARDTVREWSSRIGENEAFELFRRLWARGVLRCTSSCPKLAASSSSSLRTPVVQERADCEAPASGRRASSDQRQDIGR